MEGEVDDYVNVAIRIRPSQNPLDSSAGIQVIESQPKENPKLKRSLLSSAVVARSTTIQHQNHQLLEDVDRSIIVKKQTISKTKSSLANASRNILSETSQSLIFMNLSSKSVSSELAYLSLNPILQKQTELGKVQVILQGKANFSEFLWQKLHSEFTRITKSSLLNNEVSHSENSLSVIAKRSDFNDESAYSEPPEAFFNAPLGLPPKRHKPDRANETLLNTTDLNIEDVSDGPSTSFCQPPRRSARLSLKRPPEPVIPSPNKRRRNTRAQASTPAPRKLGKTATAKASMSKDAMENHRKYVLDILNTGSQKDLQKLALVGKKTATQIFYYRQLNGQFNRISDLAKMESWRGNGYERFLKANFLKIDGDN